MRAVLVPLVAAAASVVPAPQATAVASMSVSPAMAPNTYEGRVQYWVNRRRHHHGLSALRLARCTDRAAERWSRHLAETDTFYHQSMRRLLDRCDAVYAGETLGRGSVAPRRLVRLWMHSPEHRAILLGEKARRIGIGASPDAEGRWVVAADFMRF